MAPWGLGRELGVGKQGRKACREDPSGRRTPSPRYFSQSVHRQGGSAPAPASPAHVEKRCHGGGKPDKKRGLCLSLPHLPPARVRLDRSTVFTRSAPFPSLRTKEPRHAHAHAHARGAASRTVGLSNPPLPRLVPCRPQTTALVSSCCCVCDVCRARGRGGADAEALMWRWCICR